MCTFCEWVFFFVKKLITITKNYHEKMAKFVFVFCALQQFVLFSCFDENFHNFPGFLRIINFSFLFRFFLVVFLFSFLSFFLILIWHTDSVFRKRNPESMVCVCVCVCCSCCLFLVVFLASYLISFILAAF